MTQPDLFTSPPSIAHWRRTDPATSREAALSVPASELERTVEQWMLKQGTRGGNSLEMAAASRQVRRARSAAVEGRASGGKQC